MKTVFLTILTVLSCYSNEIFDYKVLMPNYNGAVRIDSKTALCYGDNGYLIRYSDTIENLSLSYEKNIKRIENINDTLVACLWDGTFLISKDKGTTWNKKLKLNQYIKDFRTNGKYIVALNEKYLFVINTNFKLLDTIDTDNLVTFSRNYHAIDDKYFYFTNYQHPDSSVELKYIDLDNIGNNVNDIKPYCSTCSFTKLGAPTLYNLNNQIYFITGSKLKRLLKDTFEIVYDDNFYDLLSSKNYIYNVNYATLNHNNVVKIKITRLTKDFIVVDTLETNFSYQKINFFKYPSIIELDSNNVFICGESNYMLRFKNKNHQSISNGGDLANVNIEDDGSIIATNSYNYIFKGKNANSLSSNTFLLLPDFDNNNKHKLNDIEYSFISDSKDKEVFMFDKNIKFNNYYSTKDTGRTYKYGKDSALSLEYGENFRYIGTRNNYHHLFYTEKYGSSNTSYLFKLNYDTTSRIFFYNLNTYYHNVGMKNNDYYIVSSASKSASLKNIYLYSDEQKNEKLLNSIDLPYQNTNVAFLGEDKDSVLIISYDNLDSELKARYEVNLYEIKKDKFTKIDSGYSNAFPRSFFKLRNNSSFLCGFNYIKDIYRNKTYTYNDNRHYSPNINTSNVLQYCNFYSDTVSSCNFILTANSLTSIESPQIEESAYLYTNPPRPNPATQSVSAEVYWNSAYTLSESNVSVYDIYGSKYNSNITFTSKEPFRAIINADCSNLATGIYFIRISVNGEYKTIPFTVVK